MLLGLARLVVFLPPDPHMVDMKKNLNSRPPRWLSPSLGSLTLLAVAGQAAPFLYAPGDLILTFRQSGNASDYVVNVGKAADFSKLPPGTALDISNLSTVQLAAAFPSLNGLSWSIAAANRPPLVAAFPLQTLWVTAPRLDPSTAGVPWLRKGQFVQGTAASQIDALGNAAAASSSSQPAGPNNTATGVLIPSASDFASGAILGESGNYVGTFQGSVETVTDDTFDADLANVSRADLYELVPGTLAEGTLNQPGRLLGTFELKPNGTLEFRNSAPLPPAPRILGITRQGDQTSLSVQSVAGVSYRLRFTDASGLASAVSTWSVGNPVPGTGGELSLTDTASGAVRFYTVEVLP